MNTTPTELSDALLAPFEDLLQPVHHRGFELQVFSNCSIGKTLLRGEEWEPHLSAAFAALLSDGGDFLDVGAAFGCHTITAARILGDRGVVHAFEPQRVMWALLLRNCLRAGRQNVAAHNMAVAHRTAKSKLAPIDYRVSEDNFGDGHLESPAGTGEEVRCVALDDLRFENPITLLKIDVQGVERFVLEGGRRLLASQRPLVIMEFENHCLMRYGYLSHDLFALVRSIGYHPFFLEYAYPSDHLLVPVERLPWFRQKYEHAITPHDQSNRYNQNLENGVTEKIRF